MSMKMYNSPIVRVCKLETHASLLVGSVQSNVDLHMKGDPMDAWEAR